LKYEIYQNMNKYLHITLALILLVSFGLSAKSNPEKGEPVKPNAKPAIVAVPAQNVLEQQAMEALNAQLKGLSISESSNFVPSANFLADYAVSAPTKSNRDSANALFKKLDQLNKFIDMDANTTPSLSPVKLPIGLKKHFGANNIVYVGFSRAVIKPTHAELTAFVKMEMYVEDGQSGTKKKRELFFGADGIKMTNNGKIIGDARLVLLGDYTIPMFNGKMKMILRGGEMSEANGGILNADRTFAILDCNGFREAGIMADAIFDPTVMLPLDPVTGIKKPGNVEASMRVIGGVTDFNDILATLNRSTMVVPSLGFNSSFTCNFTNYQYP
jgi:hypothetical protein